MRKISLLLTLLLATLGVGAQEVPIRIEVEEIPNRLALYAINENEQDFDVKLTVNGKNFRQSRAKPRYIRVPATSKVHMKTLVLLRGKTPTYSFDLDVNDSLSNRALKKEYTKIKVKPPKQITIYVPELCAVCDSIITPLAAGKYEFTAHYLGEKPEIKDQLRGLFRDSTEIDSLEIPIVNLGGKLHYEIETYEGLLEELKRKNE